MSGFYDGLVSFARFVIRRFFRQVEVTGLEHLPADGGGVLVSWHPNGLIDPILILAHFPRKVIFGARHGLFGWPVLGQLMRAAGAVPVYRAMDASSMSKEERRIANAKSLDALAEQVALGSFSCLFPEGNSHDNPNLLELKSGAARFYYRARQLQQEARDHDGPEPVIIPVGLHYDNKRAFRSNALVSFHPPIPLDEILARLPEPDEPPENFKARVQRLTGEIDRTLREVVHATESWEVHYLMHRVRKLVRAERASRSETTLDKPDIAERTLAFSRVWAGYAIRSETHPEQSEALKQRISTYNDDMRALGIEDHELEANPSLVSAGKILGLLFQSWVVFVLLPPVVVLGLLINGPPAAVLWLVSKVASKRRKDEATVKVLLGAMVFPVAWAIAGYFAARGQLALVQEYPWVPHSPWGIGIATATLALLGGMLSLRFLRVVRETVRSLQIRLTRARAKVAIAHLRVERAELYDAVIALVGDLDLPGAVTEGGKVVAEDDPRARYI